jgi:hypothetical protein
MSNNVNSPNSPQPGSPSTPSPETPGSSIAISRRSTPRNYKKPNQQSIKWNNENTNITNAWDANILYYEGLYDVYAEDESHFAAAYQKNGTEVNGIIDSFLESIDQLIIEAAGSNSTQISILNKVQNYYKTIADKVVEHEDIQKRIMNKINIVTLILESSDPIQTINLNFEITKKVNGKNNIKINSKATHQSISSLLKVMKDKINTLRKTQDNKEANKSKSKNEQMKYAAQTTEIIGTVQKYIQRLKIVEKSFSDLKGYYESDLTKLNYGDGSAGWKDLHAKLNDIILTHLKDYYTQQHIVKIDQHLKDFAASDATLIQKVSVLDDILNQIQALKDAFKQYKEFTNSKKRNAFPVYKNTKLTNKENNQRMYLEKEKEFLNFNKIFIDDIEKELERLQKLSDETKDNFIQSAKTSSDQYITQFKATLSDINQIIKDCLAKATEQEKLNKLSKNKTDLLDLVRTFYKYGWTTFKNTGYTNSKEKEASNATNLTLKNISNNSGKANASLKNATSNKSSVTKGNSPVVSGNNSRNRSNSGVTNAESVASVASGNQKNLMKNFISLEGNNSIKRSNSDVTTSPTRNTRLLNGEARPEHKLIFKNGENVWWRIDGIYKKGKINKDPMSENGSIDGKNGSKRYKIKNVTKTNKNGESIAITGTTSIKNSTLRHNNNNLSGIP